MATYTIGVGQTYTNLDAFIDDLNSAAIGSTGEEVIGEVRTDFTQSVAVSEITRTGIGSLTIRGDTTFTTPGSGGGARKITMGAMTPLIKTSTIVPVRVEDLEIDYNSMGSNSSTDGGIGTPVGSGNLTVNRVFLHNMDNAGKRSIGIECGNTVTVNNCVLADIVSNGGAFGIATSSSAAVTVNNCTVHDVVQNGGTEDAVGIGPRTGIPNLTVNNCAVTDTRIASGGSGTATDILNPTSQTTCLSSDTSATAYPSQSSNVTWKSNTAPYDFTPNSISLAVVGGGTDLGTGFAAVDLLGFDRHADPSNDPWNVGAVEAVELVDTTKPVGATVAKSDPFTSTVAQTSPNEATVAART